MIECQILQTHIIRIVWQRVREITNNIDEGLELKGWKKNSYHNIFSDDLHTQQISKTKYMQYSTKEI